MVYLPCHCFRPTQHIRCFFSFCFTVLRNTTQRMSRMVRSFLFIFLCVQIERYKNLYAHYRQRNKKSERDSWLFWWRMKSSRIPIAEKENGWSFLKSDTIMNETNYLFCQRSSTLDGIVLMRAWVWVCIFRWFYYLNNSSLESCLLFSERQVKNWTKNQY